MSSCKLLGACALVVAASGLLGTPTAIAETMSNNTVVSMSKAGLGEALIIDKINSESCGYDINTPTIIALKTAGLTDAVISAMVRRCATASQVRGLAGDDRSADPKVRHSPGIYVLESWTTPNILQILRPSKPSGMKTTGNGSILFPLMLQLIVPGAKSHVAVTTATPTFYFYFNPSDTNVSDFGLESSKAAQSPDEFSLVKFRLKGDEREVDFGKASAYGGSVVSLRKGVNPKTTITFDTEDEGNGIFKVSPNRSLDIGEYGFVLTGANGGARVYEFSVITAPIATTLK